jgi:hypothetical protein
VILSCPDFWLTFLFKALISQNAAVDTVKACLHVNSTCDHENGNGHLKWKFIIWACCNSKQWFDSSFSESMKEKETIRKIYFQTFKTYFQTCTGSKKIYVELERIVSGTSNTRAELLKKLKRYVCLN